MKRVFTFFSLLIIMTGHAFAQTDPLVLNWIDLIPEDQRSQFNPGIPQITEHDGEAVQQSKIGGIRTELDGTLVKIPGFVIPLEGDETTITEFLLAPYFGACIHVPPPPPNQIIYVKYPDGAPVQELWDVVYVVGELKAVSTESELAETGYLINGLRLEPYDL
jgi:hypothetical protein